MGPNAAGQLEGSRNAPSPGFCGAKASLSQEEQRAHRKSKVHIWGTYHLNLNVPQTLTHNQMPLRDTLVKRV